MKYQRLPFEEYFINTSEDFTHTGRVTYPVQYIAVKYNTTKIGKLFGGVDLSAAKVILTAADEAAGIEEVAIRYGALIQAIINFLIVALCIFIVVRGINRLKDKAKKEEEAAEEEKEEEPPEPSEEVLLLREIRDSLAKK